MMNMGEKMTETECDYLVEVMMITSYNKYWFGLGGSNKRFPNQNQLHLFKSPKQNPNPQHELLKKIDHDPLRPKKIGQ